jgi:uncharacterized protein YecT (DUF1311 family)
LNACAGANLEAADAALNKAYQALMTQQNDGASRRQLKDVESALRELMRLRGCVADASGCAAR